MPSDASLPIPTDKLSQVPTSSDDFDYKPLRDGEDFRLLSLYPGSIQDPIRCAIFHASIQWEIDYEAVSYTWATEDGDDSLSQTILCSYAGEPDGTDLRVTANCAAVLRRLRDESYERTLWIDAICINQLNYQERGYQVGCMTDIYSHASQVLVYLGDEDLGFGSNRIWLDESKRRTALEKLFAKRWVSRVWVIQEVALAQRVIMITGDVACHLDTNLLSRIRGRARAYGLVVPGPLAWDSAVNTSDLLTMLHVSRNCFSTDPRDKIYGLMSFAGEHLRSLIKIDYSTSVEEVLTSAAAAIIISREELDILTYASSSLGPRHADGRLPTWVPDWTEHREESTLRPLFLDHEIGPWRSLGRQSFTPKRHRYSDELDWDAVVQIPQNWTTSVDSKPFIIVRAHRIGAIEDTSQISTSSSLAWQSTKGFSRWLKVLIESDQDESSWPQAIQSIIRRSSWEGNSDSDLHLDPIDRSELISFCTQLDSFGENKFVFRAGHLPAVAEAGFRSGDSVWAIDGCRIPLILREFEEDKFKIVSNCQLFGLLRLNCWAISGSGDKIQWHFDPFRQLDVHDTRIIDIF